MIPSPTPARPRGRWSIWDFLFLAFIAALAAGSIFLSLYEHLSGVRNRPSLHMGNAWLVVLGSCGVWALGPILAVVLALVRRLVSYKIFLLTGISLAPLVLGVGFCGLFGPGALQYRAGFERWVTSQVQPEPIQAWLKTQTPTPNIVIVPPDEWPAEIRRLKPTRVEVYREIGVALSWGVVGHDGDRRQLFIGRNAESLPPKEVLWLDDHWTDAWVPIQDGSPGEWECAKPAVWWWLQGGR